MKLELRPTFLYRMYARNQMLLYVGISCTFFDRMEDHFVHKDWFDDVHWIIAQKYADRETAEAAEIEAIRAERPLHNVVHARFYDHDNPGVGLYGRALELFNAHKEARFIAITEVWDRILSFESDNA